MINTLRLEDFYNPLDMREDIRQPFNVGDYTVATNGHVMLAIPRNHAFDELHSTIAQKAINILEIGKTHTWHTLPPAKITVPRDKCRACDGGGRSTKLDCYECGGNGEVHLVSRHNTYCNECKTCYGDGFIHSPTENGEDCAICHGTGQTDPDLTTIDPVSILKVAVQPKYAAMIANVPGVEVAVSSGGIGLLLFRQIDDAGNEMARGAIMGMSKTPNHDDLVLGSAPQ